MFIIKHYLSRYDSTLCTMRSPSVVDAYYYVFWRYCKGSSIYTSRSKYKFYSFGPYITKGIEIPLFYLSIDGYTKKSIIHLVPQIFKLTDALAVVPLGEWFILFFKDRTIIYSHIQKIQYSVTGSIQNASDVVPIGIARSMHMFPEYETSHYYLPYCKDNNSILIGGTHKCELKEKPKFETYDNDSELLNLIVSSEDPELVGLYRGVSDKINLIKKEDIQPWLQIS